MNTNGILSVIEDMEKCADLPDHPYAEGLRNWIGSLRAALGAQDKLLASTPSESSGRCFERGKFNVTCACGVVHFGVCGRELPCCKHGWPIRFGKPPDSYSAMSEDEYHDRHYE